MRDELIQKLTEWKEDENKMGVRKISYSKFPDGQNEYIVHVSEELNITLNGKTKNILVKKSLLTSAQSDNDLNPQGDIFKVEQITRNLVIEFNDKYSNAINELFLDYEGEFFEI